jgi:hypothetical protein
VNNHLARIEALIVAFTTLVAAAALGCGFAPPLGVVLGGGSALLNFVLIRRLGAAVLVRRPPVGWLVPMALAKSLVLVAVPAAALLLPHTLIDGVSFGVGVSALPLAVVVDASLPAPVDGC